MRVARKEDKLKIKDEYNNYRVCLRYFFNVVWKDFFVGGFSDMMSRTEIAVYSELKLFTFYITYWFQ